jgi:hypothetical protein
MFEQPVVREQDGIRGAVDHGTNEIVAVVEVVIQLAATRVGAVAHVVEAHRGRALRGHQLGGGLATLFAISCLSASIRGRRRLSKAARPA